MRFKAIAIDKKKLMGLNAINSTNALIVALLDGVTESRDNKSPEKFFKARDDILAIVLHTIATNEWLQSRDEKEKNQIVMHSLFEEKNKFYNEAEQWFMIFAKKFAKKALKKAKGDQGVQNARTEDSQQH